MNLLFILSTRDGSHWDVLRLPPAMSPLETGLSPNSKFCGHIRQVLQKFSRGQIWGENPLDPSLNGKKKMTQKPRDIVISPRGTHVHWRHRLLEMTRKLPRWPRVMQAGFPRSRSCSQNYGRHENKPAWLKSHSENLWKCKESWGQCLHPHSLLENTRREGGRKRTKMMFWSNMHKWTGSERCVNSPRSPNWERQTRDGTPELSSWEPHCSPS